MNKAQNVFEIKGSLTIQVGTVSAGMVLGHWTEEYSGSHLGLSKLTDSHSSPEGMSP